MPISAARQAAYPGGSITSPEWRSIRDAILHREGHGCKFCHVPNTATIARGVGKDEGTFLYSDHRPMTVTPQGGGLYSFSDLFIYDEDTGDLIGEGMEPYFKYDKKIQIILTTAHLDHDPGNNHPDNLEALCQLHHLRYDAKHRAGKRRMPRKGNMFLDLRPL